MQNNLKCILVEIKNIQFFFRIILDPFNLQTAHSTILVILHYKTFKLMYIHICNQNIQNKINTYYLFRKKLIYKFRCHHFYFYYLV